MAGSVRPALALPDKPSIAVLPFQNMSGDPEQDYFADGIVEDIITALSRFTELFVIARNSSFTYKGRSVDVRQVGRELGVRYVLEGSVRKAGNRLRITGQLIDAVTDALTSGPIISTGPLEDVFDLQDEITTSVVGAIAPKLQQAEIERAKRKPTDSLDAYDYYLRGIESLYHWTKEASEEALRLFNKAIELDPEFGCAYGMAARCQVWRSANGWISKDSERSEAVLLARRAVAFGSEEPAALTAGGFALAFFANEPDAGATIIDRALAMNCEHGYGLAFQLLGAIRLGLPDLALTHEMRAMRLSPLDPLFGQMQAAAALAEFCAGRFIEASSWAQKAAHALQNWPLGLGIAAASCALAGRPEEAKSAAERLRQLIPTLKPQILQISLGSADRRTVRHSKRACAKPDCLNDRRDAAHRAASDLTRLPREVARVDSSRVGKALSVPTLCTGCVVVGTLPPSLVELRRTSSFAHPRGQRQGARAPEGDLFRFKSSMRLASATSENARFRSPRRWKTMPRLM